MPIHDVGYRGWKGEKTSYLSRWWIICETGIRLAAKSKWVRRILFVAWLPVMYWGIGFFFVEKAIGVDDSIAAFAEFEEQTGIDMGRVQDQVQINPTRLAIQQQLRNQFRMFPHANQLADAFESGDTARIRNDVWRWLLMVFFRYPQSILILFLIGTVAPALISRDLRSRAFLIYFSRPIGKLEYIFGKLCVPSAFIIAVTTLPALGLYIFAILMSPDLGVILNTWDIPLRIVAATFVLVIPTASLALMLSSLTHESRYANFSWFAVWALGAGAYRAIQIGASMRLQKTPDHADVIAATENWRLVSLYNCLGDVQEFVFGFQTFPEIWKAAMVLIGLTIFCLFTLYRRVSAPIQV
ncbi:MAG: ABC transporter permease [Mariniblastus sp.]